MLSSGAPSVPGVPQRILPVLIPILFAAFPLLSLFAQNQSELELSVLWWPLALCTATAVALYGVLMLITKRAAKAGALASLVVLAFFYFGPIADKASGWGLGQWWFFGLWVTALVVAVVAIVRTKHARGSIALILGVGAAVLALPQVARIASYQANHPSPSASDPRLWPTALPKPVLPSGAPRPDVYVLIPDDYERTDVLKRYFRYDDADFIRGLKRRGFVISDQARSPYSFSEMNIAAALNMDYLSTFPRVLGKSSQDFVSVRRASEDNRASRLLRSLGYRYVHLDTDTVTFAGANPDISSLGPPDSFPVQLLQQSVLRLVGGPLGFNQAAMDERFRDAIRTGFSKLAAVPKQPGPKFVVFHTLLPHDPYIFGERGQPLTFPADADHTATPGMKYYLRQLQFTSRKLLDAVDQIFAGSTTPPVVLIQADEGFEVAPELFGEAAAQDIRVKGLMAFYLPGRGRARVPQPPNTVNSLRFVFNRYLGTRYPMLRSTSSLEGDLPFMSEEIRVK
jgi:hypothetical protein